MTEQERLDRMRVATEKALEHQAEVAKRALKPALRKNEACDHRHYRFELHGRVCTCGAWMVDYGD